MAISDVRVPLVEPSTRPELGDIEKRILAERGRVSLLYRVLLNSGPIASGWERLLTAVRNETTVSPDLRELIILRIAVLNKASFEFDAHRPIAERVGVSAAKIDAVAELALPGGAFDNRERAVLALTDAMTNSVEVPDEIFNPVRAIADDKTIVELVATIAAYNMVSRFLVALRIAH